MTKSSETSRDKRPLSQRTFTATIPNLEYRIQADSSDPDADMARALQDALVREVQRMAPPIHLLPTHFMGFGTSLVGEDGERVLPQLPVKPAAPKK